MPDMAGSRRRASRVAESSLRARIAALAVAEPALADDLALRGATIEIVDHATVSLPEIRLPADLVRARLAAGTPLLDRLDLPIQAGVRGLFERLAVVMLADPAARQPAETILRALQTHQLHAEQLVGEAVVGHHDHLAALAEGVGAPSPLIETLADLAARPLLAELARRVRPALTLAAWERGYCPVCGARPLRAENAGASPVLRCGRCSTGWAWRLPACPECQNGRLAQFDTVGIAGAGRWSLMGCDTCRSYLKVAAPGRSDRLAELLVDDLVTWTLDRAALSAGLARPGGLGRQLEHGDGGGEELDDD